MTIVCATTCEAAECLRILRSADRPFVAAELASRLHLSGCRESQRRHVRAIVTQLRNDGHQIIATLQGGYFLTTDRQLWRDYIDGRQIDAKRILGQTHSQKRSLAGLGQGFLFRPFISGAG